MEREIERRRRLAQKDLGLFGLKTPNKQPKAKGSKRPLGPLFSWLADTFRTYKHELEIIERSAY